MSGRTRYELPDLLELMARLRDPASGCPWDLQQDFASIAPHTLEECYELVDAIERGDWQQVYEELGDVLFQVIFYAQLGAEQTRFDFADITDHLVQKLVRRHPHVFPSGQLPSRELGGEIPVPALVASQVEANWEAIKQGERAAKRQTSALDDVPLALPALSRAAKLQKRSARAGFDFANWSQALAKLNEETLEVVAAVAAGDTAQIEAELGDLLFSCVNLARLQGVDPERALRASSRKFERRFRFIEAALARLHSTPAQASAARLDELWEAAKASEKGSQSELRSPS